MLIHYKKGLDNVLKVFEERQLQLAPTKCKQLTVGRLASNKAIVINNQKVRQCPAVRDLGIMMTEDLKWTQHVDRYHQITRIRKMLAHFKVISLGKSLDAAQSILTWVL